MEPGPQPVCVVSPLSRFTHPLSKQQNTTHYIIREVAHFYSTRCAFPLRARRVIFHLPQRENGTTTVGVALLVVAQQISFAVRDDAVPRKVPPVSGGEAGSNFDEVSRYEYGVTTWLPPPGVAVESAIFLVGGLGG